MLYENLGGCVEFLIFSLDGDLMINLLMWWSLLCVGCVGNLLYFV